MFKDELIKELEGIQERYEAEINKLLSDIPETEREHITFSGLSVKPLYSPKDISEIDMNMWYPWYLDMEWELKIDEAVEKLFEWIPKRLEFCDSYFLKF